MRSAFLAARIYTAERAGVGDATRSNKRALVMFHGVAGLYIGLHVAYMCTNYHRRCRLPRGNGGDCPRRKTPHKAPPREELVPPHDVKLAFVQKIAFVLRKINKNCFHHSCTF